MNISSMNNVSYGQIASGNRLTSAAVSPSDLTISEKMNEQTRGLDQGSSNVKDGISALNISDGALSGITENLQRVHELSVKASNGLLSGEDKAAIQSEIDGLFKNIDDIANNTQFNTKNLLNNEDTINIASNPDGSGTEIQNVNATIKALGLDGYDVTKNFDISKVTDALDKVSKQRGHLGAKTNALESIYSQNEITKENVMSANSKISDLDMPKAISKKKQEELLRTMNFMMQKRQQEEKARFTTNLFS